MTETSPALTGTSDPGTETAIADALQAAWAARACHDALWKGLGVASGVPWEDLDGRERGAYVGGAEAAIMASGLRERLAAVTAEENRLRDQLRDLASGWLADAADAEVKAGKPRGTYGQSPSELEAEAETIRGHATAVIEAIQ